MEAIQIFETMMLVSLFFSFSITSIAHSLPDNAKPYVTAFSESRNTYTMDSVSGEVEQSLTKQTQIPIIDIGALVFYSGNFIIDLLLNFMFAIPEIIHLIITGTLMIFHIDTFISNQIQIFTSVLWSVLYILGILKMLIGIRSGAKVV